MATVTASILTTFVIASLSICVHSFPEGCTKLKGSPEDGSEYSVKVYSTVTAQTIVKMMLTLSTSECQGFQWRSSNGSDALHTTVTASDLSYMEGFGFSAKLSDAAVMWVCDQDAVDLITTSTTTTEPVTVTTQNPDVATGSGSAPTTSFIVVPSTDDDSVGSGEGTVLPATAPTSTAPTTTGKCTKITEYKDERETTSYRFIVTLYRDTTTEFMNSLIEDVEAQSNKPNSRIQIKNVIKLVFVKMIIAEMNMKAMEYVCESPRVKSIEYEVIFTIPPATPESPTTTSTSTPRTTSTTATTASTATEASTSSITQCNKLRGGPIRTQRLNVCRIYMTKGSTKADCRRFIRQMRAMDDDASSDIRFELRTVGHDRDRPTIVAKLNVQAVDMVCKSEATDMIIRI